MGKTDQFESYLYMEKVLNKDDHQFQSYLVIKVLLTYLLQWSHGPY